MADRVGGEERERGRAQRPDQQDHHRRLDQRLNDVGVADRCEVALGRRLRRDQPDHGAAGERHQKQPAIGGRHPAGSAQRHDHQRRDADEAEACRQRDAKGPGQFLGVAAQEEHRLEPQQRRDRDEIRQRREHGEISEGLRRAEHGGDQQPPYRQEARLHEAQGQHQPGRKPGPGSRRAFGRNRLGGDRLALPCCHGGIGGWKRRPFEDQMRSHIQIHGRNVGQTVFARGRQSGLGVRVGHDARTLRRRCCARVVNEGIRKRRAMAHDSKTTAALSRPRGDKRGCRAALPKLVRYVPGIVRDKSGDFDREPSRIRAAQVTLRQPVGPRSPPGMATGSRFSWGESGQIQASE